MEDCALIRPLAAEGVPKSQIAMRLGISPITVVKAMSSDDPPKYERAAATMSFTTFEAAVRQSLQDTPEMPAAAGLQCGNPVLRGSAGRGLVMHPVTLLW